MRWSRAKGVPSRRSADAKVATAVADSAAGAGAEDTAGVAPPTDGAGGTRSAPVTCCGAVTGVISSHTSVVSWASSMRVGRITATR